MILGAWPLGTCSAVSLVERMTGTGSLPMRWTLVLTGFWSNVRLLTPRFRSSRCRRSVSRWVLLLPRFLVGRRDDWIWVGCGARREGTRQLRLNGLMDYGLTMMPMACRVLITPNSKPKRTAGKALRRGCFPESLELAARWNLEKASV